MQLVDRRALVRAPALEARALCLRRRLQGRALGGGQLGKLGGVRLSGQDGG